MQCCADFPSKLLSAYLKIYQGKLQFQVDSLFQYDYFFQNDYSTILRSFKWYEMQTPPRIGNNTNYYPTQVSNSPGVSLKFGAKCLIPQGKTIGDRIRSWRLFLNKIWKYVMVYEL